MKLNRNNVKVVQGRSTDFNTCLEIAAGLPQYFSEEGITNLSKDIKIHQLFLAVEADNVRGFITICPKYHNVVEISWLAVRPEYQRIGYGTAMIDYVIKEFKKRDVRLLEVKTLSPIVNYPPYELTRRFYEKLDFILMDIIDPYPGWEPGSPCAIYVKIL